MRLFRIILSFWVFLAYVGDVYSGEDDSRHDSKALYLYPHEAISMEEIQKLDSEERLPLDSDTGIATIPLSDEEADRVEEENAPAVEEGNNPTPGEEATEENTREENQDGNREQPEEETGPKSLDRKIREAEGLLKRYYSQFLSEKRIWEDKNQGSKYSTKNEQNEVRLLIKEINERLADSRLTRDSELVYFLHRRLGDLYVEREKESQAIRHYSAALRYRNLSSTEEYFLNEDTWQEVIDQEMIPPRERHRSAKNNLREAEKNREEAERLIHRLGSDFAKRKMDFAEYQEKKKSAELNLERRKEEWKASKRDYENSIKENYLPYKKKKNREDAETFYKLAQLVKNVEDKNKERMKITNKSSFVGRGVFVLFDYKRNTGFTGYEYLLEQSFKMDNEFPPPIREVADQFKLDGKKIKSIDYYKKYLEALEKQEEKPDNEDLANVYLNLAILNSDIKRKVIASRYYDRFLETTRDENKKNAIYFELGRFYQKIIGNLDKSEKYYKNWLSSNPDSAMEREVVAYYGISLKNRKDRRLDREEENLLQAYNRYLVIRKELADKEKELVEKEREINRYKRELLVTTNDESLAQYRILQLRMEDLKIERDKWTSKYKSLPKTRIVLRLAEIEEEKRNYKKAGEYYKELIDIGNETEVSYALKNLKRLEKTMSDGILRERGRLY